MDKLYLLFVRFNTIAQKLTVWWRWFPFGKESEKRNRYNCTDRLGVGALALASS